MSTEPLTSHPFDLSLTRLIDAPAELLFRAWSDPELIKQWNCPKPWRIVHAEMDPRPGGACVMQMRGPEGEESAMRGVYLEVVPNRRLVFTDAYRAGWAPAEKPFMTGIITFAPEGGKTRYTACSRHWNEADMKEHEQMGFHDGWGICTDQLVELVARLRA